MEFQSPCLVERSPIHSRKLRVAEFDTRTADVLVEFRLALETLLNLPALSPPLSRPSSSSFTSPAVRPSVPRLSVGGLSVGGLSVGGLSVGGLSVGDEVWAAIYAVAYGTGSRRLLGRRMPAGWDKRFSCHRPTLARTGAGSA